MAVIIGIGAKVEYRRSALNGAFDKQIVTKDSPATWLW